MNIPVDFLLSGRTSQRFLFGLVEVLDFAVLVVHGRVGQSLDVLIPAGSAASVHVTPKPHPLN